MAPQPIDRVGRRAHLWRMSRTTRSAAQLSMFDEPAAQRELFGGEAAPRPIEESPSPFPWKGRPTTQEEHHAALHATLEFLRGCNINPWDDHRVEFHTAVFRMRCERFPVEIAEPLLAEFAVHAERLDFANAPPESLGAA